MTSNSKTISYGSLAMDVALGAHWALPLALTSLEAHLGALLAAVAMCSPAVLGELCHFSYPGIIS